MQFQSFTERIASIKIDVVYQTRTTSADAPDVRFVDTDYLSII